MNRWLVMGVVLSAWGCGGGSGPTPIFVGHVASLSGPNQQGGEQAARAIRLAVQEQNKSAGQNNTRPIHVRHTDTGGNLDAFEAEAVRLVSVSRVVALLGGAAADEIARLDKAQVPLVTPGWGRRGLSELVFFTGLAPAFQGQVLARFAAANLKAARVVVAVDERREDAQGLADAFTRAFAQAVAKKNPNHPPGATIIWRYGKDQPLADWKKRLGADKPQALVVAGAARDLPRLRRGLGFAGPILFGGADGSGRSFLESPDADGVYLVTAFVPDLDLPRAKDFISQYRQAFSDDPDIHAALAYDGARLLFEALGQCATPLTVEGIVKELAKLKDFPGLTGPLAFNPDRRVLRPAFVIQVEKGKLKTIQRFSPEG